MSDEPERRYYDYDEDAILHIGFYDVPEDNPLINDQMVHCDRCKTAWLHGKKNLQAWVETKHGNFCLRCWQPFPGSESVEGDFANADARKEAVALLRQWLERCPQSCGQTEELRARTEEILKEMYEG
jgi:hypothetical protein